MQIKVPDAVSIVGFDDIELAQVAYPPLTTIHVPHREMGRRAAQTLVQMLNDGQNATSVALVPDLVVRSTLGPVPRS